MEREATHRYEDPLDRVWLVTASRIGLTVRRSPEAYASTDGRGSMVVGTDETLDPDDCLAQMIFHELCHSLVQGAESFEQPDWGLCNETERDLWREHACLRVQAVLADHHGLRGVLAPTTDHRAFYDALGVDPLAGDDRSVPAARLAITRARRDPWAPHLDQALAATAAVARTVAAIGVEKRPAPGLPSLWLRAVEPRSAHPTGLPVHPAAGARRCGECAWLNDDVCRQAGSEVIDPGWEICERFEAAVACEGCGACCREAYHQVEVDEDDPFVGAHPELVENIDGRLTLRRADGRCPPLRGDGSESEPFHCVVYDDRPQTCRDFERGGESCLEARRSVGLSL